MNEQRELEWGETPFDNLTRDELLLLVKRMFSAVKSGRSAMMMCKDGSGFWNSPDGTGRLALAKAHQIVEPIEKVHGDEDTFFAFFRYADNLLFEGLGELWGICDKCGTLAKPGAGMECLHGSSHGKMRALTWADLAPKTENGTPAKA